MFHFSHAITTDCGKRDCAGCVVCNCGVCSVCGLYEGALTTDCPGQQVDFDTSQKIYNSAKLDFRNGAWVEEPNPTNQDFIKYRKIEEKKCQTK